MKIEFWRRQIFEILIIHKPSLWTRDVPQKIWARSFQPFWRLLDTNKQTNKHTDKQTDKPNLYIDVTGFGLLATCIISFITMLRIWSTCNLHNYIHNNVSGFGHLATCKITFISNNVSGFGCLATCKITFDTIY